MNAFRIPGRVIDESPGDHERKIARAVAEQCAKLCEEECERWAPSPSPLCERAIGVNAAYTSAAKAIRAAIKGL